MHSYFYSTALDDGRTLQIRSIRPEDRQILIDEFNKLPSRDVYQRFFFAKTSLTDKELTYLTEVDFKRHVALVASVVEDGVENPAGVGRFVAHDQDPRTADVAVTVVARYQGEGVGRALLEHLAVLARQLGYHALTADVLSSNQAMLTVLEHSGLPLQVTTTDGLSSVRMKLI